ncbi:DUF4386 domain-containing protein [Xanthovirga aplysinae]|uniref:DUF4386 domain-containing protein n=1 Tax=Xanthovirga aplysinae TaxID=2529853 RepID=UPI0012BC4DED|nr:DUF4386 domain-containing protein [Xanthovirga aplysinae]MTI30115.1 DUF4386 domain-containing protein [Xanthovirga aplysinae]
MENLKNDDLIQSAQKNGRISAVLYLILIPLGFFGVAYVPSLLEVPGEMATTISNIVESEFLFRLGMVSVFLMNIVSILLVLYLYKLFKPINKTTAIFMVAFLLIGACISMLNEVNNFAALFLSGSNSGSVFNREQAQQLVGLFLDMQEFGSYIATIFWGLWLFPLGKLIIKSNAIPKLLGILLIIAGIGYLIDCFILFFLPELEFKITTFTFIGEVLFPLWLLIKGINIEKWKNYTLESV